MTLPSHSAPHAARSASYSHAFSEAFADAGDLAGLGLSPGERIGRPPESRRRSAVKKLLLLALLTGAGWGCVENTTALRALWDKAAAYVPAAPSGSAVVPGGATSGTELAARAVSQPDRAPALPTIELPPPPPAPETASTDGPEAAAPAVPGSAGGATANGAGEATPDPLRKRAEAMGLHPDISRALLERLSAADFKNAGLAIAKALAETADDGALVFPAKRESGVALFRVHFVTGAGPDCRRYVVTVAKDGWLTTALPMERCGVKQRRASAN